MSSPFIAIFFDGSDGGASYGLCAEIDIRDTADRRAAPPNTTVSIQTGNTPNNWDSGRSVDSDTATYYFENQLPHPLVLSYTDGATPASIRFYRGSTGVPIYAPLGIRVYVSDAYHGGSESSWPAADRWVDETWATSTDEWTDTYPLIAATTNLYARIGGAWVPVQRKVRVGGAWVAANPQAIT